ncbi:hypothetical protein [Pseudocnuella soli]|uniref:hypothetical protein n=1 Tax=Pseudocnuella soli TaxID=2502779 RepID=UPI00104D1033|nr:hypothetical protein [Pseudocnuella soli]
MAQHDNPSTALTSEEAATGIRKYRNAEEQDLDRLREALRRTPEERFAFLMELMRMHRLMQAAKKDVS